MNSTQVFYILWGVITFLIYCVYCHINTDYTINIDYFTADEDDFPKILPSS